jgi:hypothetical protein
VWWTMTERLKTCCTCHRPLPISEFNKRRAAKDGLQARCRSCSRQWYTRNRVAHIANVRRRNAAHRQRLYGLLAEYFEDHPCVDCGETDVRCLEFDHRDRATKSAEISRLYKNAASWRVMLREIEKCDVRCANCHRRRTSGQFSTWRHQLNQEQTANLREVVEGRMSVLFPGWRSDGDVRVVDGEDVGRA